MTGFKKLFSRFGSRKLDDLFAGKTVGVFGIWNKKSNDGITNFDVTGFDGF